MIVNESAAYQSTKTRSSKLVGKRSNISMDPGNDMRFSLENVCVACRIILGLLDWYMLNSCSSFEKCHMLQRHQMASLVIAVGLNNWQTINLKKGCKLHTVQRKYRRAPPNKKHFHQGNIFSLSQFPLVSFHNLLSPIPLGREVFRLDVPSSNTIFLRFSLEKSLLPLPPLCHSSRLLSSSKRAPRPCRRRRRRDATLRTPWTHPFHPFTTSERDNMFHPLCLVVREE